MTPRRYTPAVTAEAVGITEAAIRDYRRRGLIDFRGRGYTAGEAVAIAAVQRIGPAYLGRMWGPQVTREIAVNIDGDDFDPAAPLLMFVAVQPDRENVAGLVYGAKFECFGDAVGPFVLLDIRPLVKEVGRALHSIAGDDDWRQDAAIRWIANKLDTLERLKREGSLKPDTYERGRSQLEGRLKAVEPTLNLADLPRWLDDRERVTGWPDDFTPDWLRSEDPRLTGLRGHLALINQPIIRTALGDQYQQKRAELAQDLLEIDDTLTLEDLEAEDEARGR